MQTMTDLANRPCWVDLSTTDAAGARDFYARLFGWDVQVSPDPQYGGYALANLGSGTAGGIGPKQDPNAPNAWALYIGTDDVDALTDKVRAAGGGVLVEPMDVGDQGRFAVYSDPSGAVFSGWQASAMRGFISDESNSFGWAELDARGVDRAIPFYEEVFGWTHRASDMGPEQPPYNEFLKDGESILGAWEMSPMVPAQVPSYWQVYFDVDDVDAAFKKAIELGGKEMVAPQDYPSGRFAIVSDPQGASFGLLKTPTP